MNMLSFYGFYNFKNAIYYSHEWHFIIQIGFKYYI